MPPPLRKPAKRCSSTPGGSGALAAERDRQRHALALALPHAEVTGAVVVHVPVHRGEARAEHLHAVHADVAFAGVRVARVDAAEGDVAAGACTARGDAALCRGVVEDLAAREVAVEGPALDDRELREVSLLILQHDLLTDAVLHDLRRERRHLDQVRQPLHLLDERRRDLRLHELLHAVGQRVERLTAQRLVDPVVAAERVDRDRDVGPLDVLKQQGFAAQRCGGVAVALLVAVGGGGLADAVADFGDLEHRAHACLDTREFALAVELLQEIGERGRAHATDGKPHPQVSPHVQRF
jgi:hypothetical protein